MIELRDLELFDAFYSEFYFWVPSNFKAIKITIHVCFKPGAKFALTPYNFSSPEKNSEKNILDLAKWIFQKGRRIRKSNLCQNDALRIEGMSH